jgi:hypothetical protein
MAAAAAVVQEWELRAILATSVGLVALGLSVVAVAVKVVALLGQR